MKFFFSNMGSVKGIEQYIKTPIDYLTSYYGAKNIIPPAWAGDIFLDSGAFSAFKKNETLDPYKYAEFIKIQAHKLFVYANLDVIGDAEKSWKNQKILESLGVSPIPCFHLPINKKSSNWEWLKKYAENYDYIALGGMVPLASQQKQLYIFIENCWEIFAKYNSNIKVHGFGVQGESILKAFPWFSVDASSVHVIARYGGIYTPWGTFKINPNVNAKELSWKKHCKLKQIKTWVNQLGFSFTFEEAEEQSSAGILKRCCISINYFIQLKNEIENMTINKKKQKVNLGLFI